MTEAEGLPGGGDQDRTMVVQTGTFTGWTAPEPRTHVLTVVSGASPGQRFTLGGPPLLLGRSAACGLPIANGQVSSRHCEISAAAGLADALVTDLQSTNGTFVDGERVQGSSRLPPGALVRIGGAVLRHDWMLQSELARADELTRDLDKARRYVESLLPAPITEGPVRTDWFFQPSTALGGDAFGYHQLGDGVFAGYLIDVSGHGAGAAMHSVSVMNVLRQRALPGTDFRDPAQVLSSLNTMFQMESHDGMYFSIWYGVYDVASRQLTYASAGHHPSYLASPEAADLVPLQTRNLVIGAMPGVPFRAQSTTVAAGSTLYVFSDGVFEVVTANGGQWALPDVLPLLQNGGHAAAGRCRAIHAQVRVAARPGPLDDDFSLMAVTFL